MDLAVPITSPNDNSHSTMNYRKVMTKLSENNVTYVIQTMSSMNYFDSSRTNLTYILNGSQCHVLCSFCISIIFILLI
jgi:arabinogalactan endo-1,4-beta-galactosidase